MTNYTELKKLAEAATPAEEWQFIESGSKIGFRTRSGYQAFFNLGRMHHELNEEVRANAKYVAAFNPATVLQMLSHISELERRLEIQPGVKWDGIACRDETIRQLEKRIRELNSDLDGMDSPI